MLPTAPKSLTPETVNDPTVANPVVPKLPTLAFPPTLNVPKVAKLPAVTVPVAVIIPAVPMLPMLALPDTFNEPSVPTEVRLELTMLLFNVVPVKLAAFEEIATFDATVS